MFDISKKSAVALSKVVASTGNLTAVDKLQLYTFCYEFPSITYLGLLERKEKYLPVKVDLPESKLNELANVYLAYKKLCSRQLSPIAVKMYENICIKIRLKEIVYEPCWYLPFFTKFIIGIDTSQYLEYQGWEEVFLIPAIRGQKRIDIAKIDIKDIKEFYFRDKLKVKSISKIFTNIAAASLSSREMQWRVMMSEELLKEKIKLETSNLFGKELYLERLQNEFEISSL